MLLFEKLTTPLSELGSPFAKGVLTFSIEGTTLRLMASEGRRIHRWLSVPFNPRIVSNGRIEDPTSLSTVIKSALVKMGNKPGPLVAAFPSPRVTSRIMTLPPVKGMRADRVIPREARNTMGSAVDYHDLFWSPLSTSAMDQRYFLLAAPKGELVTFLQTLSMSGLKPKKVDTRALALTRAIGADSALILNVEKSGLDVLVVVDYVPMVVSQRELQQGQVMEDLTEEIAEEFQNITENYSDRHLGGGPLSNSQVYLTGAHPGIGSGLAQALEERLGQELYFPDPPMEYPEDFPLTMYMVNGGLALKPL